MLRKTTEGGGPTNAAMPVLNVSLVADNHETKDGASIEESFLEVHAEDAVLRHPLNNKPYSKLITLESLPKATFHEVFKVMEITDSELREGFFKVNQLESPVSELEAGCAGLYKIFGPTLIPNTHAVYNDKNQYIGVFSETLPGFKSLVANPLKASDINVDFIKEKKLSIDVLDRLEKERQTLEDEEQTILRKAKKLEFDASQIKLQEGKCCELELTKLQTTNLFAQANLSHFKENFLTKKKEFYDRLEQKENIAKQELENYRVVKGLATTLTTSYIFMEDDLHRGNISWDGKRIDFDMSLWPILYHFKASILARFRKPSETTILVTSKDISNFPNLSDAKPYYWPTRPVEKTLASSLEFITSLKDYFPSLSINAYPETTNPIYTSLKDNPVFIYHKLKTLLKFILLTPDIFKATLNLYMSDPIQFESIPMIDVIVTQQMERIKIFEAELIKLPEFIKFFQENNQSVFDELVDELKKQNLNFDLNLMTKRFEEMGMAQEYKKPDRSDLSEEKKGINKSLDPTENMSMVTSHFNLFSANKHDDKNKSLKMETEHKDPDKAKPRRIITEAEFLTVKKEVTEGMTSYLNPLFKSATSGTHNSVANSIITYCSELKLDANDDLSALKKIKEMYELITHELSKIPAPTGFSLVSSFVNLSDRMYNTLYSLVASIEKKYPELKTQISKNAAAAKA